MPIIEARQALQNNFTFRPFFALFFEAFKAASYYECSYVQVSPLLLNTHFFWTNWYNNWRLSVDIKAH